MRPWVQKKLVELVGADDDVLEEMVMGFLAGPDTDPRMMQVQLAGFLEKDARKFMRELWKMLAVAVKENDGAPPVDPEEQRRQQEQQQHMQAASAASAAAKAAALLEQNRPQGAPPLGLVPPGPPAGGRRAGS